MAAFLCLTAAVFAEEKPKQTEAAPVGNCSGRQDLAKHTIRSARVRDPFQILFWRRLDEATLAAVQALEGQPYTFNAVDAVSDTIEKKAWLPNTPDVRAEFSFSEIAVEDCRDGKLDVVFTVFSARVSPTLSSLLEWRTKQKEAPHEAAGVSKADAPFQIAPEAGFDPGRRFFGGGSIRVPFAAGAPVQRLEIRGTGSAASREVSANMSGEHDSLTGWLRHAEWRLDFRNLAMPAAIDGQLSQNRLAGQFWGATRPMRGAVLRFGGMLDGGALQSGFEAAELPAGTVSSSHYTSMKLFGGITGNARKQAYAASFGAGLGSTGNTFHGGWRKLIGDASHQLWLPLGRHRLLEVEQQFAAGGLQSLGPVPVAERFFGGNRETSFLAGSGWTIRSNPMVRSIPANRLYRTTEGVGGERFFSYNSTTAVTVWGKPVTPKELLEDGQFEKLLTGAIVSQSSVLQNYYRSKDPSFAAFRGRLPEVAAKLEQIRTAKDVAATAAPDSVKPDLEACEDAVAASVKGVGHALNDKPVSAIGWVPELLPGGLNALEDVVSACGTDLVAKLAGASIAAPGLESGTKELSGMAAGLEASFQAISDPEAAQKAEADVRYVRRTLDVITKQMTITSISPVFVLDVARIGPASSGPWAGNRYGVGGGLRFTLVSTVSFTVGYAANRRPRPGEGTGAWFFSLTTRNLFE